jgi:hypothetical protein
MLLARAQAIAHAPHRLDEPRISRVALDLGAQAIDVQIDGVLVAVEARASHAIEQIGPREDLIGAAGEMVEQIELAQRERDHLVCAAQFPAHRIEHEGTELRGDTVPDVTFMRSARRSRARTRATSSSTEKGLGT